MIERVKNKELFLKNNDTIHFGGDLYFIKDRPKKDRMRTYVHWYDCPIGNALCAMLFFGVIFGPILIAAIVTSSGIPVGAIHEISQGMHLAPIGR